MCYMTVAKIMDSNTLHTCFLRTSVHLMVHIMLGYWILSLAVIPYNRPI